MYILVMQRFRVVYHGISQESLLENTALGSRGYFFLIDTDNSRRSRVYEAQSALR